MRRFGSSIVLALSTLFLISTSVAQQTSTTAIPNLIRYNGTLKDAQGTASVPHTIVGVTFAIYKQQDGGAPLWQETQNVTLDANGQYYVVLGSTKTEGVPAELFSDQDQRWLGVQAEGQPEQARVLMVSVPYAFRAHEAETLGGLPASAFVQANPGGVPETAAKASTSAAATLSPVGSANAPLSPPVSGSGKKNFIPIWTSSTSLDNSALFQIGGNVGLGTTTPGAKLDVVATPASNSSAGAIRGTGASYGLSGVATAGSGFTNGVYGQSASVNGTGVYGQSVNWVGVGGLATATSGSPAYGVWGDSLSTSGVGVAGFADAPSGHTSGVAGNSASVNGNGVSGYAFATSGFTNGVYGQSASTNGAGVNGNASATSGYTSGVFGASASTSGSGINGAATATSGYTNGVAGTSSSPNGNGVFGFNNVGGNGVVGVANANVGGNGVVGITNARSGDTSGVYGQSASTSGSGVNGAATATSGYTNGVYGGSASTTGSGVNGNASATSGYTYGVYGRSASTSGNGVFGYASATSGSPVAITGFIESQNGTAGRFTSHSGSGLLVQGTSGSSFTQVFYVDASGNGYFAGNLNVTGNLSKGGGSFKIDDPLDPANKTLSHSFVESPDMMNIYNGVAQLDARGQAWVDLPQYFEALNRDFRYQLTAIGAPGPNLYVAREIEGNRFKIKGGKPGAKVSWQVTGVRQDAYANAHRIPVEEEKAADERGHYLHPDAYGQPQSKGMEMANGTQAGASGSVRSPQF